MNVPARSWPVLSGIAVLTLLAGTAFPSAAQEQVTVTAQLRRHALKEADKGRGANKARGDKQPSAAIWLTPLHATSAPATAPDPGHAYTLLQKNKMFSPHVLVVPVGS